LRKKRAPLQLVREIKYLGIAEAALSGPVTIHYIGAYGRPELCGAYSADGKQILAIAWEPYREIFQSAVSGKVRPKRATISRSP
jgi:hypothetical protein